MKTIEFNKPIPVTGIGYAKHKLFYELVSMPNNLDLSKLRYDQTSVLPGDINHIYYHFADDYRLDELIDGGNIKVSCDGNGYAFVFLPNGICKLGDCYELYDRWKKTKHISAYIEKKKDDNSSSIIKWLQTLVDEPKWYASGIWKKSGNGKKIFLTQMHIY